MLAAILKHWRLFWLMRRITLMQQLAYRGDFLTWSVIGLMWTTFNFFFFSLILNVTGSIGGWSLHEVFVVVSIYSMLDALTWSFFHANMSAYTHDIFTGDLNYIFTKPFDHQFFLMTRFSHYNELPKFLVGLGVLIWSMRQLSVPFSPVTLGLFAALSLAAVVFVYHLWFLASTLAFYVDRLDNINYVVPTLRHIWQVPRTVYSGTVSLIVTVVVPVSLVTAIPSEVLLGRATLGWVGYFLAVTLGLVWLSRRFFAFSVRRYTGAAS